MTDGHPNERTISQADGIEEVLTATQREIRAEFVRRRGYWADDWQLILELAPEIMAAYTDVSAYAWETGTLDAKTREFMYIATTASVSHIHPIGIRTHGRNALRAGATAHELVTVLALLGGIGIAGYLLAVDVLEEVQPGSTAIRPCGEERFQQLRTEYQGVFGVVGRECRGRDPLRSGVLHRVPQMGRGGARIRGAEPARGRADLDCRQRQRHA